MKMFDGRDAVIGSGLLLLGCGLWLYDPALSLTVLGLIITGTGLLKRS